MFLLLRAIEPHLTPECCMGCIHPRQCTNKWVGRTVGSRFMRVPIMRFPVYASDRNYENC